MDLHGRVEERVGYCVHAVHPHPFHTQMECIVVQMEHYNKEHILLYMYSRIRLGVANLINKNCNIGRKSANF